MPRIRTLKPEALQHRKVGRLSDRAFRLWIACLTQADDHGRLLIDVEQLRVLTWGYHPGVRLPAVRGALAEIAGAGLIRLWDGPDGQRYACFPSWGDHQRVQHPSPSTLPEPPPLPDQTLMNVHEHSGAFMNVTGGSDRIGRIGSDLTLHPPRAEESAADWSTAPWGTPEALAHLYNTATTDNVPAVETLSPKRRAKARQALRQQPDAAWWQDTFGEYHRSRFLSGRAQPGNGHATFRADFDWLLGTGKDGSENAVKVHDGRYRDDP